MEFYETTTMFDEFRQHYKKVYNGKISNNNDEIIKFSKESMNTIEELEGKKELNKQQVDVGKSQIIIEHRFMFSRRPYYNIYPSVIRMLMEMDCFKVKCEEVDFSCLPFLPFAIRLPVKNNPLKIAGNDVQYIFIDFLKIKTTVSELKTNVYSPTDIMTVWFHHGETQAREAIGGTQTVKVMSFETFEITDGKSFGVSAVEARETRSSESLNLGDKIEKSDFENILNVALGVILIANDSELVSPDVLGKYRVKYRETNDDSYVQRSHKKGKIAFNIGKEFEEKEKQIRPGYRKQHMCHFHVGSGRKKIVYKLRRGCLVHKTVIKTVPTGFDDKGED